MIKKTVKSIKIAYQSIWFDFATADGTYTPAQLRKAGLKVQRGKEQTYLLQPGGEPQPPAPQPWEWKRQHPE